MNTLELGKEVSMNVPLSIVLFPHLASSEAS